jgi:hypothetical protein
VTLTVLEVLSKLLLVFFPFNEIWHLSPDSRLSRWQRSCHDRLLGAETSKEQDERRQKETKQTKLLRDNGHIVRNTGLEQPFRQTNSHPRLIKRNFLLTTMTMTSYGNNNKAITTWKRYWWNSCRENNHDSAQIYPADVVWSNIGPAADDEQTGNPLIGGLIGRCLLACQVRLFTICWSYYSPEKRLILVERRAKEQVSKSWCGRWCHKEYKM